MAIEVVSRVVISQEVAGTLVLINGLANRVTRLRYLCVALAANGTVQLKSGATALTGAIPVLASDPLIVDLTGDQVREACPASPSGAGMDLVTSETAAGFAVVAQV